MGFYQVENPCLLGTKNILIWDIYLQLWFSQKNMQLNNSYKLGDMLLLTWTITIT